MNCRILTIVIGIVSGCFSAKAAEMPSVFVTIKQMPVYQPENYSLRQGCTVSNGFGNYTFILTQTKAEGKRPPSTQLTMKAGIWGFSAQVRFFNLKINGIPLDKLSPKAEDMVPWSDKTSSGAEIRFNYDGAKVLLRFFMRPDSPVLWASLLPAPDSPEKIDSAQMELCLIPSILVFNENRTPVWSGSYERMAVTPDRMINQSQNLVSLTPKDTYLVIQDRKYDGSAPGKGQGPCMVQVDHESVTRATLRLTNHYASIIALDLKPDFKEFRFAIWQQEKPVSNADFVQRLHKEKEMFTRQ